MLPQAEDGAEGMGTPVRWGNVGQCVVIVTPSLYHHCHDQPRKEPPMSCQWFALCDNEAVGVVVHPVLGNVPTCQRCADKLSLTLVYDPDNPNAELLPDPAADWYANHENLVT